MATLRQPIVDSTILLLVFELRSPIFVLSLRQGERNWVSTRAHEVSGSDEITDGKKALWH
jgi:hypothetical protein